MDQPFSEEIEEVEEKEHSPKAPRPFSLLNFIFFLILLVVLGISGYSTVRQLSLNRAVDSVNSDILERQQKIEDSEAVTLHAVYFAQQADVYLKENAIIWSDVVSKLHDITPKELFYASYIGDENGKLTLQTITDSVLSASKIINLLNKSGHFQNVFVPALTKGVTSDGRSVVTFNINLEYLLKKKVVRNESIL